MEYLKTHSITRNRPFKDFRNVTNHTILRYKNLFQSNFNGLFTDDFSAHTTPKSSDSSIKHNILPLESRLGLILKVRLAKRHTSTQSAYIFADQIRVNETVGATSASGLSFRSCVECVCFYYANRGSRRRAGPPFQEEVRESPRNQFVWEKSALFEADCGWFVRRFYNCVDQNLMLFWNKYWFLWCGFVVEGFGKRVMLAEGFARYLLHGGIFVGFDCVQVF